ncbi:MAG TPA: glycosyltransferase family 2 protein [Solirubrobacterales bacterium]|nr:glycosyltransferase family 2 protein [Solirubrobacterales bacterium]
MSETVSACVIARDEEERIGACLASLAFCAEVVVVDSGSRDRTREIAAAAGAKVVENPWPGFGAQRNVAIDHARGDWILEVDADERVTPELAAEIGRLLDAPPADADIAALPLRDLFLGRALDRSDRYPRYRLRLFRRGSYRHDESRTVHEGLWADGPVWPLEGELRHILASSLAEAVHDTAAYARLEAGQRAGVDAREALVGIVVRPLVKLSYRGVVYGGWRDGWRGLLKIALECGGDALATAYRIGRPRTGAAGGFGQEAPRRGPVRIVGVASGARGAGRLEPWLESAAAAGAEVALIAPRGDPANESTPRGPGTGAATAVRRRVPSGSGPGALVRALDAEEQLRPIDALVYADRRAALRARLAPAALRGAHDPLDPREPAQTAVGRVSQAVPRQDPA